MSDLSYQRKRLRNALLQKFCEMAVGYGLPQLDALKLAQHETNKLLALPVLTENDLGHAENQIYHICYNMGLPMSSASALFRNELPKISQSMQNNQAAPRQSESHLPPRLQRRELEVLDARHVIDLIQALADKKFLREHSMDGDAVTLARYINKVLVIFCLTLSFRHFDTLALH